MRTKTTLFRAVALAALLSVFTVGSALADGFIASTSITLKVSPDKTVPAGTKITLSGKLQSDRAFCRNNSLLTLRAYGETQDENDPGGVVDTTTTTSGGQYKFKVVVTEQIRFRVWFRGKVGGVHPDIKTCEKSRSKTVTIYVT